MRYSTDKSIFVHSLERTLLLQYFYLDCLGSNKKFIQRALGVPPNPSFNSTVSHLPNRNLDKPSSIPSANRVDERH